MPNPYPWLVILTKQPPIEYPAGYFPRKFLTKERALAVIAEVEAKGGEAELTGTDFWIGNEERTQQ
jgi:hypothetical protein